MSARVVCARRLLVLRRKGIRMRLRERSSIQCRKWRDLPMVRSLGCRGRSINFPESVPYIHRVILRCWRMRNIRIVWWSMFPMYSLSPGAESTTPSSWLWMCFQRLLLCWDQGSTYIKRVVWNLYRLLQASQVVIDHRKLVVARSNVITPDNCFVSLSSFRGGH